ncbi:hypothetical protein JVT61DRAFT_9076 [Boletus reticuloceps]|uniref:MIR domain-containing protein n=1 Tax=Boletus reticuloceps TaxID=495285 RepID=A0A8I2YI26_9AGAM|nr:hypothetical protein JVT61DRAFT_9076 [Boletus reticuloceps]
MADPQCYHLYPQYDYTAQPIGYIKDSVRQAAPHCDHKALHSHDVRSPVSDVDFQNEASAYGMPGFPGDTNNDWVVVTEKGTKNDEESGKRLKTLQTHFWLRHLTGCYLLSHKGSLGSTS